MLKHTKIVCTLGPSCEKSETIEKMVKAGMNVARLNFSHGNYKNHAMLIRNIRKVSKKLHMPIGILQDLQGPKIRIGVLPAEGVELKNGKDIIFTTEKKEYSGKEIPLDYELLHKFLKPGERILISDGKIETKVKKVVGKKIYATVVAGGNIISHKGINVPESTLKVRAMTEKDKEDAKFGVEQGVDFVALSFVRTAEDILELRKLIQGHEKKTKKQGEAPIRIIAKIERREAIENIEEIMKVVDGIMIARGDLGVEVRAAEVPILQKKLIETAMMYHKPVIVATQMLDSMQESIRPTRAEVSDVANAVIDHTDAVMLSNETATGKYPVQVVEIMKQIIEEAEQSHYDYLNFSEISVADEDINSIIGGMARLVGEKVGVRYIVAASLSGQIARIISSHRPELQILAPTPSERVMRQLCLSWGVTSFLMQECNSIDDLIQTSLEALRKKKWLRKGEEIVLVSGVPGKPGAVNRLEVKKIS